MVKKICIFCNKLKPLCASKYGWHIDHIIPKVVFNFKKPEDEDFKRCWAMSNLRPLWSHDNLVKNTKIYKHFQPRLIFNGKEAE